MTIQQRPSPNITKGRLGWIPDIIVCHITEGAFGGAVSWITNPISRVSYHFVVAKDGRIVQAVPITDTAWANGTTNSNDTRDNRHSRLQAVRDRRTNANAYTISIGHEGHSGQTNGNLTLEQLNATVDLINHIKAEVRRIYGIEIPNENIVGHSDITPHWRPNCPGQGFPFDEIIDRLGKESAKVSNKNFNINGNPLEIKGFIRADSSYVHTRQLLEQLGYDVTWDESTNTVVVTNDNERGGCHRNCDMAKQALALIEWLKQIPTEVWGFMP